ncbi:hypothetical protein NliqN6_5615 [Naganishia liquefaciens]|uniref:Vacuolar protein sorting-associated protein 27 n=1 Tax=Naganishia liquefaciens TaxID=104408 RepID=A0A8H3YHC4_9TREE|nr:hypothetical protein NliqN6_5615 [Naganishia liquefaciens]
MASWIGWGSNAVNAQLEELVEKACSPLNLPYPDSQDIALELEICDLIRSKTVPARTAMLALKSRITSKNPRVQMSALGLADLCVKNGGDHFLGEVAGREWCEACVGLIKAETTVPQVREMAIKLFQSWAIAFESKPELKYLPDMYRELKNQGIKFPPPPTNIPSHLLTTATPPTWIDADACMRCRTPFTFTNRKHHCRNCGLVFDQACSSKTMPLPDLGIVQEVRVCESCWSKSPKAKLAGNQNSLLSKNDPSTPPVPTKRTLRTGGATYDADLQRAIALSLAESQNARGPGYASAPSQPGRILEGTDEAPGRVDDEDEELRLAIEASLEESRRVRPSAPPATTTDESATANTYPHHPTGYAVHPARGAAEEPEYKPLPTYDLSPREAETMLTFAQTVDHAVAFGDPDFRRFPHVHALYEQAGALGGKLVRNVEEKNTKQQMLSEMQEQLMNAIRKYDTLLTEQDNYARHQAELRRQTEQQYPPAGQYGYMPPYGYQAQAPVAPRGQPYPHAYPQQPSGHGMYPSMPAGPYPSVPQQHVDPATQYHQQGSAPPLNYGSSPPAEPNAYTQEPSQPLTTNQTSAVAHDMGPIHAQSQPTPSSPPQAYASPYPPLPQETAPYPSQPSTTSAYQTLPQHETGPPPFAAPSFPAFPDAPTQIVQPPVASSPEKPKEALLIEL